MEGRVSREHSGMRWRWRIGETFLKFCLLQITQPGFSTMMTEKGEKEDPYKPWNFPSASRVYYRDYIKKKINVKNTSVSSI